MAVVILSHSSSYAFHFTGYQKLTARIAGETYQEHEIKLAYTYRKGLSTNEISSLIRDRMSELINSGRLSFSSFIGTNYRISSQSSSKVFKDLYFDSGKFHLYNLSSSYRLRYRWNSWIDFKIYSIFPYLKNTFPTRCEIQFKTNYKLNSRFFTTKVSESRFEFRNESAPFIYLRNAPDAPWPEKDFQKIAKRGIYSGYRMLPTWELSKMLVENNVPSPLDLTNQITLTTIRNRLHLLIDDNPWQYGPNAEQVIIISVDQVFSNNTKVDFFEIEIELDRNTNHLLNATSRKDGPKSNNAIFIEAGEYSKKAKGALLEDLSLITKEIKILLRNRFDIIPMKPMSKYGRIVDFQSKKNKDQN